ncbi:hypothetical protein ABPG75_000402 [Micractinium tetrahymenae]
MGFFAPAGHGGGRGAQYVGRWTWLLCLGIFCCMLLGFNYGYDLGVTGGVTGMKTFRAYFFPDIDGGVNTMWCHFSDPYLQLVTSTAYIASVPASLMAFWLVGWRGRVLVLFLGGCAYVFAAGLQAGSQSLAMLYAGRAVVGIGMAFGNQAGPVYMSEVALPRIRGSLISFYQFAVVIGILVAQLVNYGTGKVHGQAGWRISLGVFGGPALLAVLCSPFLLDSPDSLVSRGKLEDARRALQRIRGSPDVDLEFEDIQKDPLCSQEHKRAMLARHPSSRQKFELSQVWATLKWAWGYRVHLAICFMLGAFRALTGNPLLLFYAPELFQTLGTSQNYSLLSAVTQGCVKVVGTVAAILLVDRVGRKKLQLLGGAGQLLMQVAAALITGVWFDGSGIDDSDAWALTVVLCVFEFFFEISIATLSWVIATEICPLEIRSIGAGFLVMGDLMLQVFFTQMTLTLMCALRYGVFLFSAGFCLLFILFSLFLVPETKGVSSDEIQDLLRSHWLWKRHMAQPLAGEAEAKLGPADGMDNGSGSMGSSGGAEPEAPASPGKGQSLHASPTVCTAGAPTAPQDGALPA